MKRILQIAFTFIVLVHSLNIEAIPARNTTAILTQPDGTMFTALLKGDEFMKIFTTADGYAIIQDEDGFYSYATYDPNGGKYSTGIHVKGNDRSNAPASSMNIPFEAILQNAMNKKAVAGMSLYGKAPLMERLYASQGLRPETKAGAKIEKKVLVLLVQYADVKFKFKRTDFVNMMTQKGYSGFGATGCAEDYFEDQFNGEIDFSFDVSEIITLSKKRAYYGGNDRDGNDLRAPQMVREACMIVANKVNFSEYDSDSDGVVDNLFVFFAGGDEAQFAGEDCIWSHAWSVNADNQGELVLDGVKIDAYACTSELFTVSLDHNNKPISMTMAGIGTFCHEYSHTLGLPDFYDTDYDESGGSAAGFHGSTSVMDSGPYNNNGRTPPSFNAVEREMLGITIPTEMTKGKNTLFPIANKGNSLKMATNKSNEYYLIEYRKKEKWDKYIGGEGVLLYHIDKSSNNSGYSDYYKFRMTASQRWDYNEINCNPAHQCADLIEACGYENTLTNRELFFPHKNNAVYWPVAWDGTKLENAIYGIKCHLDRAEFYVGNPISEVFIDVQTDVFQDCAIISWTVENIQKSSEEAEIRFGTTVKKVKPVNGKYSVFLDNLTPNKTYNMSVNLPESGHKQDINIRTMAENPLVVRHIVVDGKYVKKTNDLIDRGSKLPLVVMNANNSTITWTFNDKEIKREEDGYFTISGNGTLKAVINHSNGGKEIIIKEIRVN